VRRRMRYSHKAAQTGYERSMSKTHSLKHHPIAVRISGAKALVIGGGKIAERKVLSFLEAGASVEVISPDATALLRKLAGEGEISWRARRIRGKDLIGVDIAVAATNDARVNENVSRWAHKNKILINVVDNPRLSNFISPAVFRNEKGIVSVYTDGKDPAFSRDMKNFLKENWSDFLSYRNRSQTGSS